MKKIFFLGLVLITFGFHFVLSQKCKDFLVFDGSEEVSSFGMDTTGNWWIVTKPFQSEFRLIISGYRTETYKEIRNLTFSPDGTRWIFLGRTATNWNFVSSDTMFPIFAEEIVSTGFSQNSENYFLAYKNGIETTILYKEKKINITNFTGKIFFNFDGSLISFVVSFGKMFSLIIPGRFQSDKFDNIIPLGFWFDDDFIFAGKKGNFWQIFKNKTPLTEEFIQLIDMKINLSGTNAVFVIKRNQNDVVSVLYSQKFAEPIFSKSYDYIGKTKLHPEEPLATFFATKELNKFIVYGNVEYSIGEYDIEPFFVYDGSEIYYCFCNIDCYFYVDGRRYTFPGGIACSNQIARKPKTNTIAFSNYTSLVLLDYLLNIQYSGMMVDKIIPPIFNWKKNRYETLGEINNKIYLLTCEP